MAEGQPEGVKSVARVFDLLELIADAGGDVTLSELSTMAELPLPTIHRLLRNADFVEKYCVDSVERGLKVLYEDQ